MKKLRIIQIGLSIGVLLCFSMANATLRYVNGGSSSEGTAAKIITAPLYAEKLRVTNFGLQGFNEAQGVTTTQDFAMDDDEVLPAGSFVDSHMIFLNAPLGQRITHEDVRFTFGGDIIGVMSDKDGNYEAASTEELGSDTTEYEAPYSLRGMEIGVGPLEGYSISGKTLTINMLVTSPGDWIRVVTIGTVTNTVPALPLLLLNNND